MGVVIECLMLFAALLADMLLGNYGFVPCLTVFVLFRASQCVSLRFAVAAALVLGTFIDLAYCRTAPWTPLWYVLALYAGLAAVFRRGHEGGERFLRIVYAGAAIGGVMTLRWILDSGGDPEWGYFGMACDMVSGVGAGVLKLFMVVLIGDFLCGCVGANEFFKRGRKSSGGGGRRRLRRVRAEKVAGRRS